MSGEVTVTAARARLAALKRHGSPPGVVDLARTELAAANARKFIAGQREAAGLPPAATDLERLNYLASVLLTRRVA